MRPPRAASVMLVALLVALLAAACDTSRPLVRSEESYKLVFESFASQASNQSQLFALEAVGEAPKRLFTDDAPGAQPRVSANGRWVAYMAPATGSAGSAVSIAGVDGAGRRSVFTSAGEVLAEPAPSPDGSKIAFVRYGADPTTSRIWVVNADGTEPHVVTTAAHGGGFLYTSPAWSPDGARLVLALGEPGALHIGIMPAGGGTVTDLTQAGMQSHAEPAWSPDGTRVAYVASAGGSSDIMVIDVVSRQQQTLYSGSARNPAWAPQGDVLGFSARISGAPADIYVVPQDGGVPLRVTTTPVTDRYPNWALLTP